MRTLSFLSPLLPAFLAICGTVGAQDTATDRLVHLRYAEFDPTLAVPFVPPALRGGKDTKLWIVQFDG